MLQGLASVKLGAVCSWPGAASELQLLCANGMFILQLQTEQWWQSGWRFEDSFHYLPGWSSSCSTKVGEET